MAYQQSFRVTKIGGTVLKGHNFMKVESPAKCSYDHRTLQICVCVLVCVGLSKIRREILMPVKAM